MPDCSKGNIEPLHNCIMQLNDLTQHKSSYMALMIKTTEPRDNLPNEDRPRLITINNLLHVTDSMVHSFLFKHLNYLQILHNLLPPSHLDSSVHEPFSENKNKLNFS